MERNQTHQAIWGQCIGDAIGRHLLNRSNASQMWTEYSNNQQLPFKKGRYSVYAQHSLLLVQQYQGRSVQTPQHFTNIASSKLRRNNTNTMLCRAIRNQTPFDTPDVEASIRLGPLATCFDKHDQMLQWIVPVSKLVSTHSIAVACSMLYASTCWHLAQGYPSDKAFSAVVDWSEQHLVDEKIWWAHQQCRWILENGFQTADMIDFLNSFLETDHLTAPSSQQALSIVPLVLFHATQNDFVSSLQHCIGIGGEMDLIVGMTGCLAALQSDIPDWLAEPFAADSLLKNYPIQSTTSSAGPQFKLF